jgi:hypothetical protein
MRADRLLTLADFLEKDERVPDRFGFASWVGIGFRGDPRLSCGTSACALGWATQIPEFQELGLILVPYKSVRDSFEAYIWFDPDHTREPMPGGYYQATAASLDSAQRFFEIDGIQADWLFIPGGVEEEEIRPNSNATAHEVAAHIRRFVQANGVPEGMYKKEEQEEEP